MMLRTPLLNKRPRPHPDSEPELRESQELVPFQQDLPLASSVDLHLDCDFAESNRDDSYLCTYKCKQMVKSEVLLNLEKQEKKIFELTSELEQHKNLARAADADKNSLVERIKRLEQEEAALSAREKSIEEKYMTDMESSEERFRVQLKRCEDLEVKLQQEMRLRAEAEKQLDKANNQIKSLEATLARNEDESKRQIRNLEECLNRAKKDTQYVVSKTNLENSADKSRLQFSESEIQRLKDQCEDLQQRLLESLDEKRDLSQKLAMATSQVSSSQNQDMELIVKHLRDELKSFEADVAEARKIKQFHANVNLLKEKLESERSRAERAEKALEDLVDREMQIESLKRELQTWKSLLDEVPGVEKRDDIVRRMADLQRETLSAAAKVGELTAQLMELQSTVRNDDSSKGTAQVSASTSKDVDDDVLQQNRRLKRKVELLTKERDGLKSILASYDEEENVISSKSNTDGSMQEFGTPAKAKDMRIQELESLVQDLQKEGDMLRSELAKAETKLGRGHYDASITKVVHMVENLDVNADKQVLLAEIKSLRDKLKSLQEDSANSGIAASKNAEVALLREQISSLEKREARYKKVFAEKISLFRQACGLLFGYMVEMSEEHQSSTGMTVTLFILQSIYAQSEDEKIEFQLESNRMNLRANEYTSTPEISRMVEVYCKKFKSIPAFTANLTSELFNKSTVN